MKKLLIILSLLLVSLSASAVTVTPTASNLILAGDVSTDKPIIFTAKVTTAGTYALNVSELPGVNSPCANIWIIGASCYINTEFHVTTIYDGATLIYDNRLPIPKVAGSIMVALPLSVGTHKITVHSRVAVVPASQRLGILAYFGYSGYNFSVTGPA
jgi:hypothetical protein